jgi:GT2 family glycosyltransferase
MHKIGIVGILYKSNNILEDFLRSISIQNYKNYELILVDNSPSDETDELVYKLIAKFAIQNPIHIKLSSNSGAAEGNNIGIRTTLQNNCSVVLLTNIDVSFTDENLFARAIEIFNTTSENIIIPKMYCADGVTLWWAGAGYNSLLAKAKHYGYMQLDTGKYDRATYTKYAPTTFMFIKKEVFDNVGLIDPKYVLYYEDIDWIFRCRQYGYKLLYYPALHINHLVSYTTGGELSLLSLYYAVRNRLYFTIKNLPFYKWIITIPYILLITFLRFFKYNEQQRKAVLNGIRDGFKLYKKNS